MCFSWFFCYSVSHCSNNHYNYRLIIFLSVGKRSKSSEDQIIFPHCNYITCYCFFVYKLTWFLFPWGCIYSSGIYTNSGLLFFQMQIIPCFISKYHHHELHSMTMHVYNMCVAFITLLSPHCHCDIREMQMGCCGGVCLIERGSKGGGGGVYCTSDPVSD